jgi:hypothetical protein
MDDVHLPPPGGVAAGVHEEPYLDEQVFDFLHPHGVEFVDPLPPPSGVVVEEFADPLPPPGGVGVDDDFEFDLEDIDLDIVDDIVYPQLLDGSVDFGDMDIDQPGGGVAPGGIAVVAEKAI